MNFILIEERAFALLKENLSTLRDSTTRLSRTATGHAPEEWLDSQDVCLALGFSKRSLQYYRAAGIIPYSTIGNKVYYPASKLRALLDSGTVKPKTHTSWKK